MNTQKSMQGMGFKPIKQVELTNYLLNNLQSFNLKPTTKLVLLYLSSCYNPKRADVFPKQRTIADKIGISEASVIRAISELHKEGLIISERKYSNRYKFTHKLLASCSKIVFLEPEEMQVENKQIETIKLAKCELHVHEQIKEQIKEQEKKEEDIKTSKVSLAEFEKLKQYATSKGAKNPAAYANKIIQNGNTEEILKQIAEPERIKENAKKRIETFKQYIDEISDKTNIAPPSEEVRQKAAALIESIKMKRLGL